MYQNRSKCQKQFLYTTCSPPGLRLEFSYIELVIENCRHIVVLFDAKIRASDKDLPVNGSDRYVEGSKYFLNYGS